MKLAAFNAVCPFEIGDKIGMRKNACAVGGRTLDVTPTFPTSKPTRKPS